MHFCGNVWHDLVVNALLILCALPLLRSYVSRVLALLSSKKETERGEED